MLFYFSRKSCFYFGGGALGGVVVVFLLGTGANGVSVFLLFLGGCRVVYHAFFFVFGVR